MPTPEITVTGTALIGEDLEAEAVEIVVADGTIAAIEPCLRPADRWICPAFFNAHTHLGDTVAMDCSASGSLAGLVAPPNGLKHRILASTPRDLLAAGMRASINIMLRTGTAGFADFREGGPAGVAALREAAEGLMCRAVIFGRDGGEREADGIGISSVRDVPDAERQVREARRLGKLVAIHAGERDPDDIDGAIALEPDLLIHCTHATDRQLRECADRGIPIAVCPRSNWLLGVADSPARPPIPRMLACGCTVLLGTDNAMFVQPDLLQEMAFASFVYRAPPEYLLRAAVAGSALAGRPHFIREGADANFFIVDCSKSNLCFSSSPVVSIVRRLNGCTIEHNVLTLR
ncbi:putative pyrimidine deaminase archaeal [hydrocarbon metagenome]|uniref:Putative pyrimidine deaminase archaeal n=1 Tax=hydrocarbon metagenome TaxID=938273 RepID=A0A0W8FFE5_9ZZZZ|nr:amidohydrolase family protein [Methanomicrobiaceae archaeon]